MLRFLYLFGYLSCTYSVSSTTANVDQQQVSVLNDNNRHFVNSLRNTLSSLLNNCLDIDFIFKHSYTSNNEQRVEDIGLNETYAQCGSSALNKCEYFVLKQADLYYSQYIHFIEGLLRNGVVDTNSSIYSSFTPIMNEIQDLRANLDDYVYLDSSNKNHQYSYIQSSPSSTKHTAKQSTHQPSKRVEMGGGSGFGFQLYCDDAVVLTAGAGGGGGIEGDFASHNDDNKTDNDENLSNSYGSGSGGGVQFNLSYACEYYLSSVYSTTSDDYKSHHSHHPIPRLCELWRKKHREQSKKKDKVEDNVEGNTDFFSIGDGGGCGTTSRSAASSTSSSCGVALDTEYQQFMVDNDLTAERDLQPILEMFFRLISSTCKSIRIEGGGGGGGGTAECCEPFMIGYGFNFALTSSDGNIIGVDTSTCAHKDRFQTESFENDEEKNTEDSESSGRIQTCDSRTSSTSKVTARNSAISHRYLDDKALLAKDIHMKKESKIDNIYSTSIIFRSSTDSNNNGNTKSISPSSLSSSSFQSCRYQYDPVGALMYQSSLVCKHGYADWCCVCSLAKQTLQHCISKRHSSSPYSSSSFLSSSLNDHQQHNNMYGNDVMNSYDANSRQLLTKSHKTKISMKCSELASDVDGSYDRMKWLLHVNCCADASSNSNKKSPKKNHHKNDDDNDNNNDDEGQFQQSDDDRSNDDDVVINTLVTQASVWCTYTNKSLSPSLLSTLTCVDENLSQLSQVTQSETTVVSLSRSQQHLNQLHVKCVNLLLNTANNDVHLTIPSFSTATTISLDHVTMTQQVVCDEIGLIKPFLNLYYQCHSINSKETSDRYYGSKNYVYFSKLWWDVCLHTSTDISFLQQPHNDNNHHKQKHRYQQLQPRISIVFVMCYMIAVSATLQLLTRRYMPYQPPLSEHYQPQQYHHSSSSSSQHNYHAINED